MKDEKNKQPQQPQHQQSQQKQGDTGQKKASGHPSKNSDNNSRKGEMKQPMDVGEGDIENPDQQEHPGKKTTISDDPDQTKKKVPDMHK